MTYKKMKALQSLATAQGIELKTVKEFADFVRRMKV